MNKEGLISFENWTIETFNAGKLRSPVHLAGSIDGKEEEELIRIFKDIKRTDYVLSTYRSHHHALLHGISEEWLKNWILSNKSIHVMNKEHNFITSAIVAGTLPTAIGLALAIKRKKEDRKVFVFIGDMTAYGGTFHECFKYAINHNLPIKFIVENNFLSTDTQSNEVWGVSKEGYEYQFKMQKQYFPEYFDYYTYTRKYPHYGSGKFIS